MTRFDDQFITVIYNEENIHFVKRTTRFFLGTIYEEQLMDLVQETFIRAYKGFPKFRSDSKPQTWLYVITRNNARDFHRRQKGKGNVFFIDEVREGKERLDIADYRHSTNPLLCLRSAQIGQIYRELTKTLDKRQVQMFEMSALSGVHQDVIADLFGTTTGTVKNYVFRVRQHLQSQLTQAGFSPEILRLQQ